MAFDVSNLAVAARMAFEISTLTETARMIPDVSKLGDVVRLASELSKVAQAAIVNPEFYKVATYAMRDFSEIAQIDLADDTEEAIEKLAMRGWSLPWHLSIGQARDLMDEDPDEIDAFFEAYFEDGGLEALREDILGDKKLGKWKVLLDQCFKNYSGGGFQICIPSLISVLEGSFDYLAFFDERRRKKFFEERIQAATSFHKLTWISLHRFCDVVFMSGDPRRATDYINRHKVMHGSDDPSGWKKVDCLRLFQALDSTRRLK